MVFMIKILGYCREEQDFQYWMVAKIRLNFELLKAQYLIFWSPKKLMAKEYYLTM